MRFVLFLFKKFLYHNILVFRIRIGCEMGMVTFASNYTISLICANPSSPTIGVARGKIAFIRALNSNGFFINQWIAVVETLLYR